MIRHGLAWWEEPTPPQITLCWLKKTASELTSEGLWRWATEEEIPNLDSACFFGVLITKYEPETITDFLDMR